MKRPRDRSGVYFRVLQARLKLPLMNQPRRSIIQCSCLHVALLAVAGCGDPETVYGKLRGRVTSGGQPVPEVLVVFQEPTRHLYLQVATDHEGRYDFDKYPGAGLPAGNYRVALQRPIQAFRTGEPLPPLKPFPKIEIKYLDPEKSGLAVQIDPGENRFDIKVPPIRQR